MFTICRYFVGSLVLLFLISDINAIDTVTCEVATRNDPFDSGFQTERTQTVYCEFSDDIHITTPSTLLNPVNENVTLLLLGNSENVEYLPQDISAAFPNLIAIDASGCSVKTIGKPNFVGLSKLRGIILNRNQLERIDEDSFDDTADLSDINLDDNKLVDLPSKLFATVKTLDVFRIKNNQLQSIDADLFQSSKLVALLQFTDNKLKTLPSGIFDGLTELRQLWLNGNEIEDLPPHIFDDCNSLIDLDLSRNKIKIINNNWLAKLIPLQEVSFSRNPLEFIDLTIFDSNANLVMFFFNGVGTKDIRHIEKVDQMTKIKGIGLHDTCVDGQFHEGNLNELKQSVKDKCVV